MLRILLVGALVFNLMLFKTNAMAPEQRAMVHKKFEALGAECIEDHIISEKDINDLRSKILPSGENVPCFLACIMKKIGVLDEAGMFQKETSLEVAKEIFNNEEELKVLQEYLHSCSYVNSEPVGDGAKGCERTMKAYKCMLENASQFGIDL